MTYLIATIISLVAATFFYKRMSFVVLIITAGLPLTRKLRKFLINPKLTQKKYLSSLVFQIVLLLIPAGVFFIFFTYTWFISLAVGYFLGLFSLIITFIFSYKEFRLTQTNIESFKLFTQDNWRRDMKLEEVDLESAKAWLEVFDKKV